MSKIVEKVKNKNKKIKKIKTKREEFHKGKARRGRDRVPMRSSLQSNIYLTNKEA